MKKDKPTEIDFGDLKDLRHLFKTENITPGASIRAYRNKCNVTQRELAEITGITEQNLSSIENGRREIGVETAEKIAAFFGIHPSFILFPNGPESTINKYKSIYKKGLRLIEKKRHE